MSQSFISISMYCVALEVPKQFPLRRFPSKLHASWEESDCLGLTSYSKDGWLQLYSECEMVGREVVPGEVLVKSPHCI